MSGWARKRFWTAVETAEAPDGYGVTLDGRPVRTPGKAILRVPTEALARAIAEEWEAQSEDVRPETMPLTQIANSAIDKVSSESDAVVRHLAGYAATDLLCYRAEAPAELVARQAAAWDPWLDWAAERHNARLRVVSGVIPVDQDAGALARLEEAVSALSTFELSAFHDLVALPGSLILALAVTSRAAPPGEIWETSRLDESWQIEQWGADDEAEAVNALKRKAFLDSARFFHFARE